jgi:hypothetical protein
MLHAEEQPTDGCRRQSGRRPRCSQPSDKQVVTPLVSRTVRDWAVLTNLRITGGTGQTHSSFTVRANTGRATGARLPGILALYADSHGTGPALEGPGK